MITHVHTMEVYGEVDSLKTLKFHFTRYLREAKMQEQIIKITDDLNIPNEKWK